MFVLDENSLTLKLYSSFPGELIYLRSSDRQEFWPALFEKAYAKYETSLYCLRLNVKTPVAFVMNIILSVFFNSYHLQKYLDINIVGFRWCDIKFTQGKM